MNLIIVGATGYVGSAITNEARKDGHKVISIGRSPNQLAHYNYIADFSSYKSSVRAFESSFSQHGSVDAVIYSHRARSGMNLKHLCAKELCKLLEVELTPYLCLRSVIQEEYLQVPLRVLTITSHASKAFANDTCYQYHIVKHAQVAASLGLSFLGLPVPVYSNILSFGELKDDFLAEDAHDSARIGLFAEYAKAVYPRPIPTLSSLARLAINMCMIDQLCGQTISLDSGLGITSPESLLRSYAQ
jgi:NAD(P)-dependent dehydrogenase (short-subunit alcohol dehydrogenase family)